MGINNFWLDRPVLVTGATGLLGSWLIKRLWELQATVIGLVRDWVPQSELVRSGLFESIQIVYGDICDKALLERVLGEYEIDTVFHLAAQTIVPIAHRNPISTFETNIRGTWELLEACRRSPLVKQIILASSDKAYGNQEKLPYHEDTPLEGRYPYDVSKSCADLIGQTYAKNYDLPIAITRCGNFYGGGDLNWNRIVPGVIRSVIRNQRPVIRSNGKSIRDYFYIEDGVAAYLLLVEKLAENRTLIGHAFNFSNEHEISVLEMANQILRLMNSNLELDVQNEATHEIGRQCLSAHKAHQMLDWKPLFDLETGLKKTLAWYDDFFRI